MNAFFDIPEVTQMCLISKWLVWRDITHFDSAVCCHKRRTEFQKVITSAGCIFHGKLTFSQENSKLLDWIVLKHCKLCALTLSREQLLDTTFRRRALTHSGSVLESLTIRLAHRTLGYYLHPPVQHSACDLHELSIDIDEFCPNLHSLHIQSRICSDSVTRIENFSLPTQLQTLRLTSVALTFAVLDSICNAAHLTHLELPFCTFPNTSSVFYPRNMAVHSFSGYDGSVCHMFPNLTSLTLVAFHLDQISTILEHCVLVKEVNIIFVPGSPCEELNMITPPFWPHLQKLKVTGQGAYIPEPIICSIISHYPNLTTLCTVFADHSDIQHQTSRLQVTYPANYSGSRLTTLAMKCNESTTLQHIVSHCAYLQILLLSQPCNTVGRKQVRVPAISPVENAFNCVACSSIRQLYLQDYLALEGQHLEGLRGSNIELLSIQESHALNDTALTTVLPTLPVIHTLRFLHCTQVTEGFVLQIPVLCKYLRSIMYDKSPPNQTSVLPVYNPNGLIAQMMRLLHPQIKECIVRL